MSDEVKQKVIDSFSKNTEAYVTSSTHKNQSDLDLITEWLQPERSWTVLDIATGGGHVAKELSRSAGSVIATDLTKDMLENTARHLHGIHNIQFVIADAEQLPFLDGTFDAVTCRIAAHHFPNPDLFIHEVQRVLKPSGRFLMIDNIAPEQEELDSFYNTFEKMRDPSHARALNISEWKQLMEPFNIEKELPRKKRLPFQDWLKRKVDDPDTKNRVQQYFLEASEEAKRYFSIEQGDQRILSFAIDEWMVMAKK
ncbi:class I SAM-dependent methyltransferase [Halobacillus fulvus]|nr:class I SAM-dependent methyltransferase [Halobacillus fulvus]